MAWTLDDNKIIDLGANPNASVNVRDVMHYVVGCIKRERARIAELLEDSDEFIKDVVSDEDDDDVFVWA